jgi:sugar phosphate isomerase/epimerase
MFLTGIADEAGPLIDTQIKATKELGWQNIEARVVEVPGFDKGNIHDIPDRAFDELVDTVNQSGIKICGFGSTIANWAKKIDDPAETSLAETRRAIPRMQRLGTKLVRIMSYAPREADDQMAEERFRRLREITSIFLDAGIQPAHENDVNYGGMGWQFTLKLLENVPGLKLVFDTGNPVHNVPRTKPQPWLTDSWEFYTHVRPHIQHLHIKDIIWDAAQNHARYVFPGEGQGHVRRIVKDLLASGYDGGISIEPHMAVVFHDKNVQSSPQIQYDNYLEYGRRMTKMVNDIQAELKSGGSL